ncbi:MAG: Fe-S cluster assembly protein SufD [Chitinophagaceae bacterium]|nr:Fe-S cluster assembly protein SufD [Chitinophagaceae bacterium]
MNTIENIKERFQELQSANGNKLKSLEQNAFDAFNKMGIPTARHEEWKYTRIGNVFNKELHFKPTSTITPQELDQMRLPGHENANEIVFVNGIFSTSLSNVRSKELTVKSLKEASAGEFSEIVSKNLGNSNRYSKDGIHALNSAFAHEGVFIHISNGKIAEHPVYIYHITDARETNVLAQPRNLVYVSERAEIEFAETHFTLGVSESFTNEVLEIVVEKDANVSYYKIQNDKEQSSQVCTTHFRQVGKSYIHAVTISLNGGMVRNNLNITLEAEHAEAHLYGLYFLQGNSHVDNHTVVDHVKANCLSNELYKGIVSDNATAVFNGKIFVQPHAQKTNAYQSNKNILLSEGASVNTKPQLEIFADDVKCSHGCTVGQLDEEGLFYLRSRGISEDTARSLLVHAFAIDILEHVKPAILRSYVDKLIFERLEFETS